MRAPEGRLYPALVSAISLALAGAGLLVGLVTLAQHIGPFGLISGDARPTPLPVRVQIGTGGGGGEQPEALATPSAAPDAGAPFAEAGAAGDGDDAALSLAIHSIGPRRSRLDVTNRGEEAISGAVVRLEFARAARSVEARGTLLFQAPPGLRFVPGQRRAELLLPELEAGQSRSYTLDVDPR